MNKYKERGQADSCFNRATEDEMIFVLLERDEAAPAAIREWIKERIKIGKNKPGDVKLIEAEKTAQYMEEAFKEGKI